MNPADTQTLTVYNTPGTTLTIQKLVTGTKDKPLAGVEFLITDSSGAYVGPNKGIYKTDEYGRIVLSDLKPGTVITAKETATVDGFVLDGTPKSILYPSHQELLPLLSPTFPGGRASWRRTTFCWQSGGKSHCRGCRPRGILPAFHRYPVCTA